MPRYFIDTDDGDCTVVDEDGHVLAEASAIRPLVMRVLAEMAACLLPNRDRYVLSARVRNSDGETVYAAELVLTGEWLAEPGK